MSIDGKPTSTGLGRYTVVTLAVHRERALESARSIVEGHDPRRRTVQRDPTLAQARHRLPAAPGARGWARDRAHPTEYELLRILSQTAGRVVTYEAPEARRRRGGPSLGLQRAQRRLPQARIAFEHVVAFMGDRLADKRRWRVWDTAQQARIEDRETGARVRCIGSDPRRAHGLAPVLVLADEPAQWPESTGERMVAALRTAAGKQPHSRFVALGTRPADPGHWYWPATGALTCLAAFPAEPNLAERGLRDGVGGLYAECARRGELLTLGQRSVDIPALMAAAMDRFGRPSRVVADRWREAELRDALDRAAVPRAAVETRAESDSRMARRMCGGSAGRVPTTR